MVVFFNPFKKHDVSDFPDVYIPLERFNRDPHMVAAHDEKSGVDPEKDENIDGDVNTLEGLRAEIELGMRCPSKHTWAMSNQQSRYRCVWS